MDIIITITAFTVAIPFVVGLYFYKRVPWELVPVVILCGVWLMAEGYSYYLRARGLSNAHVSYLLTPLEIFLFTTFYFRLNGNRFSDALGWSVSAGGLAIVLCEYLTLNSPLNTFSLGFEFILVTLLSVYTFFQTSKHSLLNLTLLFYILCSFPYFFAWEWLRVNNVSHLMLFASIYAYTHSACYIIMAIVIWKYSLSSVARSASQR